MEIVVTYMDGTTANGEEISHYPSAVVEADSLSSSSFVDRVEIVRDGFVLYSVEGSWK